MERRSRQLTKGREETMSKMPTAQEIEEHANRIAMLGIGQTVVMLCQFASLLRQTTEGTDAHIFPAVNPAGAQVQAVEARFCRTYEQLYKASVAATVAVCIEICQEESTDNGTAQKIEARIRALKVEK